MIVRWAIGIIKVKTSDKKNVVRHFCMTMLSDEADVDDAMRQTLFFRSLNHLMKGKMVPERPSMKQTVK